MISFFMMYESLKSGSSYSMDFDAQNQFEGATLTFAKNYREAKKEIAVTVGNKLNLGKKEAEQVVSKSLRNKGFDRKDSFTDDAIENITNSIIASYADERSI